MTLNNPYLARRCAEIEGILVEAATWASDNEELGAHLAAYISVLITGVVEDCIEHLVTQRAKKTGDSEIENYVRTMVGRFRNPYPDQIRGLLGQFSVEYKQTFAGTIPPEGLEASALKSIIDNKNSLAHLGIRKLQMTIGDVDDYFRRILPILETLEHILS